MIDSLLVTVVTQGCGRLGDPWKAVFAADQRKMNAGEIWCGFGFEDSSQRPGENSLPELAAKRFLPWFWLDLAEC